MRSRGSVKRECITAVGKGDARYGVGKARRRAIQGDYVRRQTYPKGGGGGGDRKGGQREKEHIKSGVEGSLEGSRGGDKPSNHAKPQIARLAESSANWGGKDSGFGEKPGIWKRNRVCKCERGVAKEVERSGALKTGTLFCFVGKTAVQVMEMYRRRSI